MKEKQFRAEVASHASDIPEVFTCRMEKSLEKIVIQEAYMKESTKKVVRRSSHALVIAIALTVVLASVALAVGVSSNWSEILSFMLGPKLSGSAEKMVQSDLHRSVVNGVEIRVSDACYDGRTLFLQYSYIIPDAPAFGAGGISEEAEAKLASHNVGNWIDSIWINGKEIGMANNSGSVITGSDIKGEIIHTEYWRLDNIGITLNGPVQISLPIGERQPLSDYSKKDHPEKYNEDGTLKLPEKGIVTFNYDASSAQSNVQRFHPQETISLPFGTTQVTETALTPLMTYITLKLEGNPDAMAAYKKQNGEGHMDENGSLIQPFSAMDLYTEWLTSLELVDGNGHQLFPDNYGCNGYGDNWAEYVYPHIKILPDKLYLAPIVNGTADMTQAVKVK